MKPMKKLRNLNKSDYAMLIYMGLFWMVMLLLMSLESLIERI